MWHWSQEDESLLFGNLLDKSRATVAMKYTRQLPILFRTGSTQLRNHYTFLGKANLFFGGGVMTLLRIG